MKLWIARDPDGRLKLFESKPELFVSLASPEGAWVVPAGYANSIWINKRAFPEVTFENSPMEVELVIKK